MARCGEDSKADGSLLIDTLYAVVGGAGRGKTRLLAELSQALSWNSKVLCVAITFDKDTDDRWRRIWSPVIVKQSSAEELEMIVAVNIFARILAVYYKMDIIEAYELIKSTFFMKVDLFHSPGMLSSDGYNNPVSLIQECVKHVVTRHHGHNNGGSVDHFVLLVDESAVFQQKLDLILSGAVAIHNLLRTALLTFPIKLDNDEIGMKIDLIMSVADMGPLSVAPDTGLEVVPISLPKSLDINAIWTKGLRFM